MGAIWKFGHSAWSIATPVPIAGISSLSFLNLNPFLLLFCLLFGLHSVLPSILSFALPSVFPSVMPSVFSSAVLPSVLLSLWSSVSSFVLPFLSCQISIISVQLTGKMFLFCLPIYSLFLLYLFSSTGILTKNT